MRSEFKLYYQQHPKEAELSFMQKMWQSFVLCRYCRKFQKLKQGSEKWHKVQHQISLLSATNLDCRIREKFYEITMGVYALYTLPFVVINFPENLTIGRNSTLNRGVNIVARVPISIGENVIIGPYCIINSGSHHYKDATKLIRDQGHKVAPIVIEDDVFIGARVSILPGITIHRGAVIGAGAVVTKSVESNVMVCGVPARQKGARI